ncbi:MAG: hypothetical protein JXA90_09855 [Planctomycetes bacterium]|nr:hypothetical protein [Planctomycetota bacterium]
MGTVMLGMTFSDRDPGGMTVEDRRVEIAGILAAGYLRILAREAGNRLADLAAESADGTKTKRVKEVA